MKLFLLRAAGKLLVVSGVIWAIGMILIAGLFWWMGEADKQADLNIDPASAGRALKYSALGLILVIPGGILRVLGAKK